MSPIEQHPKALSTGRYARRGIHSQQFEPGEALERASRRIAICSSCEQ